MTTRLGAIVLVCALATPAIAAVSVDALSRPSGVMRGVTMDSNFIGFETVEGYTVGDLNAQNGWQVFNNYLLGTDVALRADNNGQAMRLTGTTAAPAGDFVGGFSPTFNPVGPSYVFTIDTLIDDNGGANYDIVGQAPASSALLTFRVSFDYLGSIFILDQTAPDVFEFIDTGVSWVENQWNTLTVTVDADSDTIEYAYGGSVIYSSSIFAGSLVEEVVVFSDNFQFFGGGSFSGGPAAGWFDNIDLLVPAPATGAAALAAMTLLLARRRR